jgi:acyl dehydratase
MYDKNLKFTSSESLSFANVAGDWNPIHVDEVAARRTMAGETVVHGIHAVLGVLSLTVDPKQANHAINYLHAVFEKPIFHENDLSIVFDGETIRLTGPQGLLLKIDYMLRIADKKNSFSASFGVCA